jgi:urease accessory protein
MRRDSATMRESGSTLFTSVRQGEGVDSVVDAILSAWKVSGAMGKNKAQASV